MSEPEQATASGLVALPQVDATQPADSWRNEVAARLERYRTRRTPRPPRYPSLFLPFDSTTQSKQDDPPDPAPLPVAPARQSLALRIEEELLPTDHVSDPASVAEQPPLSGRLIEFPRSAAIPMFRDQELAEPLLQQPRILEAPEVLPPPPALGGILIEPQEPEPEKRSTADAPLLSASLARRLLAGLLDALICGAALVFFAAIFLQMNPPQAGPPLVLGVGAGLAATLLWAVYQFLFVVYAGTTPGLRVARLRLIIADGSPVPQPLRSWRVLASLLSILALGLGYLWSFLDEDGLCWHDRITHTYVAEV